MAAPTVATEESGDGDPELADDGEGGEPLDDAVELAEEASEESDDLDPEPGDDPKVDEVDLSDDDLGGSASDLFTGSEDASTSSSDDSSASTDDSDDEDELDDDALDALGARGESMEEAINDGAARLAVVGLDDDDEKEGLQEEFTEVFEAFRLGYFGSRFFEEYVFTDDDDEVDPMWGLFGAALTCTAFIVWMRPDGDEMVAQAKDAVEGLIGGSLP